MVWLMKWKRNMIGETIKWITCLCVDGHCFKKLLTIGIHRLLLPIVLVGNYYTQHIEKWKVISGLEFPPHCIVTTEGNG